jgi:uncharacterized protein YecT (DUF1311 family)
MDATRFTHPLAGGLRLSLTAGALAIGTMAAVPAAGGTKGSAAGPVEACLRSGRIPPSNMTAVEACNLAELDRRDAELNRLYAAVIHRLPPPQARTLREAERTWIEQRDTTCQERARRGADENAVFLQCQVDETGERAQWLRNRYKQLLP